MPIFLEHCKMVIWNRSGVPIYLASESIAKKFQQMIFFYVIMSIVEIRETSPRKSQKEKDYGDRKLRERLWAEFRESSMSIQFRYILGKRRLTPRGTAPKSAARCCWGRERVMIRAVTWVTPSEARMARDRCSRARPIP